MYKKVLSCMLVMVLLASAMPMVVMPTGATGISSEYKELFEGDNEITKGELASAISSYMLGEGALQMEELRS